MASIVQSVDEKPLTELLVCVETHRKTNVGTIMRCAVAFGASLLIVVGSRTYSTHGAHEAKKFIQVIHFYYWHECVAFVKARGCTVYSISPYHLGNPKQKDGTKTSMAIQAIEFNTFSAAFIIGERQGLTEEQQEISDMIVHVSFPRQELEEYIPYDNKIAVVFQRYTSKTVGFAERGREGEKYCLKPVPLEKSVRKAVTMSNHLHDADPITSEDGLAGLFEGWDELPKR
jgi:tRNA C32,U32 (ribose-2'-O)-methylase TrmJ